MDVQTVTTRLMEVDARSEFRDALQEMKAHFRSNRQFFDAGRVRRVLRNRRLFEELYEKSLTAAATDFAAVAHASELGDGELFKWLIEWFSNGGWEIIIEFIKQLIPLFAGLGSVVWFVGLSGAATMALLSKALAIA